MAGAFMDRGVFTRCLNAHGAMCHALLASKYYCSTGAGNEHGKIPRARASPSSYLFQRPNRGELSWQSPPHTRE